MKAKLTKGTFMRLPLRGMFLLAAAILLGLTTGTYGIAAQTVDDHGDTLSTATPLSLGSSISGRIDPGNDPDVFRLDLSGQSGSTHVWVYTTGSLDTLGGLYDSAGERVSINDNTTASSGAIIDTNLRVRETLPPAVYYIGVFSADNTTTGDYTLHVKADDHSHYLGTATPLALDTSVAGRISPGFDGDAFRLDLSGATGNTHVWVYTTGDLDTWGRLYDSNGDRIAGNDDTTRGDVIVETNFRIHRTLAPGVYYVWVLSADGITAGNYTLHAKTDDHGDLFSTASTLDLGSQVQGAIDPGFDRDVFRLDLSRQPGNTHISIFTTGSLDTQGWLYDSSGGDWLTRNDDITRDGQIVERNFRILWTLTPGIYYLSVRSADRTVAGGGNYTLQFQTRSDDHGNSFRTATNLSLGSSIAGRIEEPGDDWDVFKLDLSGTSGTTDVWLYTTGDLNTRGWLLDSDGGPYLVFNNDSFIKGRESGFHIRRRLPSGIYYVQVQSWLTEAGEFDIGDYTLHIEAVADPGSNRATATALAFDSPSPGAIDSASDSDYFRLVLTESKFLVIYAIGLRLYNASEPLDVTVLDNRGAEISVNVSLREYRYRFNVYRWGFSIEDDFDAGVYYVKVTAAASDAAHPVFYTIHSYDDTAYPKFIDDCGADTAALNDPQINDALYSCQWHLRNRDQGGKDINVEAVWAEGIMGEGVNVAVVDDGMYHTHEDLAANVNPALNHNYDTGSQDIYHPYNHHGTNVAGVIAARDNNNVGTRGVAPRATLYGYNFLIGDALERERSVQDINMANAMTRNRMVTAVSNNSWGPTGGPWLGRANRLWELAVDSGLQEGYHGKGAFYAFAAGNGGRGHRVNSDGTPVGGHYSNTLGRGDDANLDELASYHGVTAVCAVNDGDTRSIYSEKGANLWVCAPSWGIDRRGIITTENVDRYIDDFSGTSAAAPMVSGVAALLRQANPDLSWRDLKLILAASARKNDPGNSGWSNGARKYGAESQEGPYHFNHEYGFGVVDAKAAVDLSRTWVNVPPMATAESTSLGAVAIPPPSGGTPQTVTTTLTLDTFIRFTEFVEINTNFDHTSFRDMDIELVSPSGAVSKLAVPFNTRHYYTDDICSDPGLPEVPCPYFVQLDGEFRFGSARHLGEDPNGQWMLRLTDHFPALGGTLRSWNIRVYGHVPRPGPPSIISPVAVGAGSLTVGWDPPAVTGGPAIVAYDLRHIETSADEGVDDNWTVVEKVWTTGSGPLQYIISGLTDGVSYDVQVRAVSSAGAGVWSGSVSGVPDASGVIPPIGTPVFEEGLEATRLVKESAGAGANVGDPVVATDPENDILTYGLSGADESSFEIDAGTGQITLGTGTTLDYEAKGSFKVSVTATDPSDHSAKIEVAISVIDERLGEVGSLYDTNKNRMIETIEALIGIRDYFAGVLSTVETLTLLQLYFASR